MPGWRGDDEGSVSAFVVVLIVALMVVAGLVVDGGRAINARADAMDAAEQAARAGAAQLDQTSLRSGGAVRLDRAAAEVAARDYLRARGYPGKAITATAGDAAIEVTVRDDVATSLLQLLFIDTMSVQGRATARPALGITSEIPLPGGP